MQPYLIVLDKLILNIGFWMLSLICEIPYCFMIFILMLFYASAPGDINFGLWLWLIFFGWLMSLICRLISLHVFGAWIMKRLLLEKKMGLLAFGLADFILASLWVGIWFCLQPDGFACSLFDNHIWKPNALWFICIPPIGLGSATFRLIFGKKILSNQKFHGAFGIDPKIKPDSPSQKSWAIL